MSRPRAVGATRADGRAVLCCKSGAETRERRPSAVAGERGAMNPAVNPDMEAGYLSPAMMQEAPRAIADWARDAAAYREAAGARAALDLAYGDEPRRRLDIFAPAGGSGGPVALFVHGGYWQAMDKSSSSHVARGANAHGITVVVAGYTLCPATTMAGIVEELRMAVAFIAKRFGKPVTVFGHSAGGHLTACLLATDWRAFDPALPPDTVPAGLPISGLFELEPLIGTTLNERLRLDAAEARRLSPLFWPVQAGKRVSAHVGANESSEFLRQTRSLVERWGAAGVAITGVEVPHASHFGVIAALADPASAMTRDLVELARGR